jgi:hypothetical protein
MVVVVGGAKKLLGHLEEETCGHGPEVGALQKGFNRGQVVVLVLSLLILGMMVAASRGL